MSGTSILKIYFTTITFFLSVFVLLMPLGINPVWAQHNGDVVINPLTDLSGYLKNPQEPAPIGIGAYGFYYDNNGILQSYTITTDKELAVATINSLSAYNPSLPKNNDGANLQFNVMLEVKTSSGTQIIWLQNTARFDTLTSKVNTPHNNIWNLTTSESSIKAIGQGTLNPSGNIPNKIIYADVGPEQDYSFPLTLKLGIAIKQVTQGVMVYFYNEPFGNGIFDKVLLPIQNVISANLIVDPDNIKKVSIDSELIWGGYCCGYETTFNNMDSYLSMYYANTEGKFVPFQSLFTFGIQTAEKANNLQVLPYSSGGHVVVGENNNHFLKQLGNTSTAVPEFGPMVSIVSILAIISMIMISKIKSSNHMFHLSFPLQLNILR
jgi:hypothetical protein